MGRMAKGARKRPWSPPALRAEGAFEERLRRLWFDTHVDHPQVLDLLAAAVGPDHLVYGTNFGGWDAPPSTDEFDVSLTPNARRLLRLEAAA